jgi:hypothetical protein
MALRQALTAPWLRRTVVVLVVALVVVPLVWNLAFNTGHGSGHSGTGPGFTGP